MWTFLRRRTLTQWILVAMALGTLLGWAAPDVAATVRPLATVFLRMIKSIIVPLIFGTLVVGIAGHGDDLKRVGRLAFKAIVYFEVVTTLALAVGLVMVNLVRPGAGVPLHQPGAAASLPAPAGERPTLASVLEHIVPQSFFEAATQNEVLQIVFWAVLFALALSLVRGRSKDVLLGVCEAVAEVMFKFTGIVMRFAPIGVGAAIAFTVGTSGLDVLRRLGVLVLTLYGALVVFGVAVLLPVAWLAKVPLGRFLRAVKEPALIAFSTASSEAALPTAMEHMEAIGVPRRIVAFVMPTGYSFNLDGSTLYLAVASVFVAQAAGVTLSLSQQLLMMLTLMVASKGLAGVPRAAIVILSATLASFHLPVEAIGVLLGVDVLMDMARTSVNLVGNCLATVVMARWEGEYDVPANREGAHS
ncbi:MAG: dicarboxylate/amino acid:cation symporter [Gemmatimonadetes bacterium 13_1_40CM_4_69_8]|nr:MAG: dicarboxylate/amino acid:cation symporter [Gemmatimonadetes bacterium 13_1_40CM_70_15]OLC74371.1 MAG: dicarboxylate/amino acid:cation symporter [Gemmatimonadetes bacterium 13_1_40CM_4_69_8]PYP74544.1 MAG: dicarboxylate/amino acid:cation symporter [Gemmatimonadota bacterium]